MGVHPTAGLGNVLKIVCENCGSTHDLEPPAWVVSSGRAFRFRCASCGHAQMVPPPTNISLTADDEAAQFHESATPDDPEGADPGAAAPAAEDAVYLKQDGKVYLVRDWATLERWIAESRVGREDLVSIGGVRWEPIGSRPDLVARFVGEHPAPPATPRPPEPAFPFTTIGGETPFGDAVSETLQPTSEAETSTHGGIPLGLPPLPALDVPFSGASVTTPTAPPEPVDDNPFDDLIPFTSLTGEGPVPGEEDPFAPFPADDELGDDGFSEPLEPFVDDAPLAVPEKVERVSSPTPVPVADGDGFQSINDELFQEFSDPAPAAAAAPAEDEDWAPVQPRSRAATAAIVAIGAILVLVTAYALWGPRPTQAPEPDPSLGSVLTHEEPQFVPLPAPEPAAQPVAPVEPVAAAPEPEPEPPAPEPEPPAPAPVVAAPAPAAVAPSPAPAPASTATLVDRGWARIDAGDTRGARTAFEAAIAQSPGDANANYGYGYLLASLGRDGDATRYLCAAVSGGDESTRREAAAVLSSKGLACP